MKSSELKSKEYWKPEYWKQKYCKLIRFRLENRLDRFYNSKYHHHHHIKPKSICGKNNWLIVLTKFEHCVAHYYLRQYFKCKKDKDSFNKMDLAFMALYGQCGFKLRNAKHRKMFFHRKSTLEKNMCLKLPNL